MDPVMDPGRTVLAVSGHDAVEYLDGQASQDLSSMGEGEARWSLLLEPQGKIAAFFRAIRVPEGFLLDIDRGHEEALIERIERFRLRSDVTVARRDDLAVRSHRTADAVEAGPDDLVVEFEWAGWTRIDLVGPADGVDADGPDDEYEVQRIRAGFPRMGHELTSDRIPNEVGGLVAAAVDFDKGCYVGQEQVARIDSRGGNVPRRMAWVDAPELLAEGTPLRDPDGDRDVGWVTSAAMGEHGPIHLGFAHRSVADGARVDAGGEEAVVVDLGGAARPG